MLIIYWTELYIVDFCLQSCTGNEERTAAHQDLRCQGGKLKNRETELNSTKCCENVQWHLYFLRGYFYYSSVIEMAHIKMVKLYGVAWEEMIKLSQVWLNVTN
jgi:hypothetical protein